MKTRYIAEAKFLRAYYYFDLLRLFKNIPLFTAPLATGADLQPKQADPAKVYEQIEADLKMLSMDCNTVPASGWPIAQPVQPSTVGKVIIYQNNTGRMLEAANLLEDVNGVGNVYGFIAATLC